MDEYISRGDVLDIASQYCPDDDGSCSKADVDLREMLDEIEALPAADAQSVGGWISVDDKLPENNKLVLCYARSTTGEGNSYFLGAIVHGEFWFLKVNDIGHVSCPVLHWEVTHWQPLPEPPKDGDTE